MSRTYPQFKLRMPPALRARVEQAAEQANRSLNAEIVTRLQASFTQVKPEVSANEESRPVSPPTACRQLRLLCVLRETQLGLAPSVVSLGYLPIHTMQRLPPRSLVAGKWAGNLPLAGLYLREAQARQPTATVLARCERHRLAHAFRAVTGTVRTGGVSA